MALKATVYKAQINIADMDRNVYLDQVLTVACHPSETIQRMMLRILAWVLNADERLSFTKGLCADDEPELWIKNFSDEIELWVELGLPEEKRLRKACHKSQQVLLYAYGDRAAPIWWEQNKSKLSQYPNLRVVFINDEAMEALEAIADRTMNLQFSLQDGQVWISAGEESCTVIPDHWLGEH